MLPLLFSWAGLIQRVQSVCIRAELQEFISQFAIHQFSCFISDNCVLYSGIKSKHSEGVVESWSGLKVREGLLLCSAEHPCDIISAGSRHFMLGLTSWSVKTECGLQQSEVKEEGNKESSKETPRYTGRGQKIKSRLADRLIPLHITL